VIESIYYIPFNLFYLILSTETVLSLNYEIVLKPRRFKSLHCYNSSGVDQAKALVFLLPHLPMMHPIGSHGT